MDCTPPAFIDRRDAGRRLAEALAPQAGMRPAVVGLARGGVAVAAEVASVLGAPLDALAVRKIGHPQQPEYALGAVAPHAPPFIRSSEGVGSEELQRAATAAAAEAERLDGMLHARRAAVDLEGTSCILVDDGLATGATMVAAVGWAHQGRAARVVVGVPVGAIKTLRALEEMVDAVVCPCPAERFWAVGSWYVNFDQVGDQEVIALLDQASQS